VISVTADRGERNSLDLQGSVSPKSCSYPSERNTPEASSKQLRLPNRARFSVGSQGELPTATLRRIDPMTVRKILVGSLLLLAGGFLGSAQQAGIREVPIKNVDPTSGLKMYRNYCAACHGTDGKGTGPAAKALKTSPGDLTTLAQRNHGKFPAKYVHQAILGDAEPAPHANQGMPAWSGLFLSISGSPVPQAEVEQRAFNLTTYVKSLQQ